VSINYRSCRRRIGDDTDGKSNLIFLSEATKWNTTGTYIKVKYYRYVKPTWIDAIRRIRKSKWCTTDTYIRLEDRAVQNKGGTLYKNNSDDDCLERSWSRMQMQYFNHVPICLEFVLNLMESNLRKNCNQTWDRNVTAWGNDIVDSRKSWHQKYYVDDDDTSTDDDCNSIMKARDEWSIDDSVRITRDVILEKKQSVMGKLLSKTDTWWPKWKRRRCNKDRGRLWRRNVVSNLIVCIPSRFR
jgi:hypothetical protein